MDAEIRRRLVAARGYAGFSRPELAQRLGVSKDTLQRIEGGQRSFHALEDEGAFLAKVASACGLPQSFFTADFGALDAVADDGRRLLEEAAAELERRARATREHRLAGEPATDARTTARVGAESNAPRGE